MNPTERLRALLDERGVEWDNCVGPFPQTAYNINGVVWQVKELVAGFDVSSRYLTPAQAIDATLGRGECTFKWSLADNGWADYTCSECGFTENTDIHVSLGWKFCPNCGRTVVTA